MGVNHKNLIVLVVVVAVVVVVVLLNIYIYIYLFHPRQKTCLLENHFNMTIIVMLNY